ncbi:MAG TPA: hypothetical protein VHI52_03985, partial [Verrucomicrobiae bacterium]|nr:hypothetical protein [Verrucomicrobiae bacterium]
MAVTAAEISGCPDRLDGIDGTGPGGIDAVAPFLAGGAAATPDECRHERRQRRRPVTLGVPPRGAGTAPP